jgi:RimJ/RimL family protein N-acetyltransferase
MQGLISGYITNLLNYFFVLYKCLRKNNFAFNDFTIEPLREAVKYSIMQMRNEQMYHLRQSALLTEEAQDQYFENVVSGLFAQENPDQLLFSFLKSGEFIGYGGLVHINWLDKYAEISFIMKTEFEAANFEYFWINYLKLIEKVAFEEMHFHKLFTYAFDVRPHLYKVLEKAGFNEEARLKKHHLFGNTFVDVLIHSKFNSIDTFPQSIIG